MLTIEDETLIETKILLVSVMNVISDAIVTFILLSSWLGKVHATEDSIS